MRSQQRTWWILPMDRFEQCNVPSTIRDLDRDRGRARYKHRL